MPSRFFMIIGHGKYILNENEGVDDFTIKNRKNVVNVITLAPPTAGCFYAPENLLNLKDGLVGKSREMNDIESFYAGIDTLENEIMGFSYCSDDWLGYDANKRGYDPSKGCSLQTNTVLEKTIIFKDDHLVAMSPEFKDLLGVWYMNEDINFTKLDPFVNKRLIEPTNGDYYSLKEIVTFLHEFFSNDDIYILDCSCNVVEFKSPGSTRHKTKKHDSRLQRRIQRNVIHRAYSVKKKWK